MRRTPGRRTTGRGRMRVRLLIVDDDELTCRGMQARIRDMRFAELQEVEIAFSAEEALDSARALKVDVLLTDVRMVDMNGLELIAEIQRTNPKVLSIIMTAYANFEYAHQAIKLGAVSYTHLDVYKRHV